MGNLMSRINYRSLEDGKPARVHITHVVASITHVVNLAVEPRISMFAAKGTLPLSHAVSPFSDINSKYGGIWIRLI